MAPDGCRRGDSVERLFSAARTFDANEHDHNDDKHDIVNG
jgi:hypothetical protein